MTTYIFNLLALLL